MMNVCFDICTFNRFQIMMDDDIYEQSDSSDIYKVRPSEGFISESVCLFECWALARLETNPARLVGQQKRVRIILQKRRWCQDFFSLAVIILGTRHVKRTATISKHIFRIRCQRIFYYTCQLVCVSVEIILDNVAD